jgi:hypothetical protein
MSIRAKRGGIIRTAKWGRTWETFGAIAKGLGGTVKLTSSFQRTLLSGCLFERVPTKGHEDTQV